MVPIDARLIDAVLLGQGDHRRQLQDFPILGDVWIELARDPRGTHELLLTPHRNTVAPRLAAFLATHTDAEERMLSYVHGLVMAEVTLEEVWRVLLPATSWWERVASPEHSLARADDPNPLRDAILEQFRIEREIERRVGERGRKSARAREEAFERRPNADRQIIRLGLLLGLLAAARSNDFPDQPPLTTLADAADRLDVLKIADLGAHAILDASRTFETAVAATVLSMTQHVGLIWRASMNRMAEFALERSVPAIKADAAAQLFNISCSGLSWAILDSGIDADHPAFRCHRTNQSRVRATYDFGRIKEILNKANAFNPTKRQRLAKELAPETRLSAEEIDRALQQLAEGMKKEAPVSWTLVEPLIKREYRPPAHPHGTHVAGILAADWRDDKTGPSRLKGVCPDINLYDFRVLGSGYDQSEFAIIAALQFIRYLNTRSGYTLIDGVNMSLSIPHNVRNYACGYTPVCVEAEKLVANGVIVVAAAGNRGYQQYQLADNSTFESYAASSITDPGNADAVITVGSTHRNWPHTYGVSFFSSRGPTGDGRPKPDLLAPGERIDSCVPGPAIDTMDGTSMAAPHVSGAAALLIARHQELKGNPARVKKILCATATDLGRERHFQGHGMLDVLRAIQSI